MFSLVASLSGAASESSWRDCGVPPAPGLVICDPANLCAEAIRASVRKHTAWHVECATTDLESAACTAAERGARAIVFDSRRGTPKAVSQTVGRLRSLYPDGALMLLTAHEGAAFMRSAIAAGVAVCVHKRDELADFRGALEALSQRQRYCSRIVRGILGRSGSAGTLEERCTGARRSRLTCWHSHNPVRVEAI